MDTFGQETENAMANALFILPIRNGNIGSGASFVR